jgi:periplasmic protein TonB
VFDEVTKTEGGKRAARRSAFLAGSTLVQVLFVAFLIVAGERIRAAVKSEPVVDVKFVRPAAPKPPPPPPPAPARKKPPTDKPKVEMKKAPAMAMIQPKTVEDEIKPADPNEPEEDYGGDGEGVEGGVVGGVVGGQVQQGGYEEAPKYVTSGFKPPVLQNAACIRENTRIPPQLAGFVSGPITVKFAVYSNGAIGAFQVMGQVPDPRIGDAIKNAITSCAWTPGTDPTGKPTALYVIMPFRFSN